MRSERFAIPIVRRPNRHDTDFISGCRRSRVRRLDANLVRFGFVRDKLHVLQASSAALGVEGGEYSLLTIDDLYDNVDPALLDIKLRTFPQRQRNRIGVDRSSRDIVLNRRA